MTISERKWDRQRRREIDEALRLLLDKLPWHSVFSHDKMNHPGPRRAGRWVNIMITGKEKKYVAGKKN